MTEYSNGLIIRYVLLISSVFNRYPSLLKNMSLTDRDRSLLVSKNLFQRLRPIVSQTAKDMYTVSEETFPSIIC